MKKQTQLASMPKLIMAITLIVMVGAMFGAAWYLINNQSIPATIPSEDKTEYK